MCGFVGFANLKENISSKTNIYNMNESISKRGPDEDGYYYEEHICLGFSWTMNPERIVVNT